MTKTAIGIITGTVAGGLLLGAVPNLVLIPLLLLLSPIKIWKHKYQQGLKGLVPASDAEGLLKNVERPPVRSRDGSQSLSKGQALPHLYEVDEG